MFEKTSVPPEMLLVRVRVPVSDTTPLNVILLVPLKMFVPPLVSVLAMAFEPLRSVLAEMVTPLSATVLPPNAALLPRLTVPALSVVAPV